MGFRCTIYTKELINSDDIENILDNLPESLSNPIINTKQNWGWSCGLDVYKPESKSISVGGSYGVSGHISEPFVDYLSNHMKEKGYTIKDIKWDY